MANAKPASAAPEEEVVPQEKPKANKKVADEGGPKIEFFGEGADKVKFTVDPKAKRMRVYANGLIITDY
jgi:hypothetical protein